MNNAEKERVIKQLVATAEIMGHELKPTTALVMSDDLAEYGFEPVMRALTRCRRELTGKLTLKAILDILAPGGGWLTANEAWSLALPAQDERNTVVWSNEARAAWFVALPILDAGDKVGARMAFIAAYDRAVEVSKNEGREPQFTPSFGEDARGREAAISQAQERGLLPKPKPAPALPPPTPEDAQRLADNQARIRIGLKELAGTLTHGEKAR